MEWYLKVLRSYAEFDGRARRKEFWMFFLINLVINYALMFIGLKINLPFLSTIYGLAILIPYLAVWVRRMHDVGKSGWYLLIPIYYSILAASDSVHGPNEYGPNPKGLGNEDDDSDHLVEV